MKNRRFWVSLIAGILAGVMILGFIFSLIPTHAHAATTSSEIKNQIEELEKQQQALEDKIDELKGQQNQNATEIRQIMEQKNLIDQQVGLLYSRIDNLNEQISAYNVLIADKQEELEKAQKRLADLNEKNKERIRAMEEDGTISYWSVLFKANSFSDLLDRLNMIEEIAASDRRRLQEMSEAAEAVEQAKADLQAERANLLKTKETMTVLQLELEGKSQEAQALLSEMIAKGEEFDILMEELEDEKNTLTDDLADKKVEYDEAKYAEYMATATQPTKPAGGGNGGTEVNTSGITWLVPVDYTRVSSAYGWRNDPFTGERKFHNGVDLAGGGIYGKPIYASRSGVVSYDGWYGSGGWTIKIDHLDGYVSIYMHMTHYIVNAGDYVTAGQVIGYVGSTGGSTGPHLHFEIRFNGASVNPMGYIG